MATFIEINADIFNVDKIQAIIRRDEKNRLGYDYYTGKIGGNQDGR